MNNCFSCKHYRLREVEAKDDYYPHHYCMNATIIMRHKRALKKLIEDVPGLDPFLAAIEIPRPEKECPYYEKREVKRDEW